MNLLINANAKRIPIADNSVNCVVTSPPYYGLRDYGVGDQIGLEQTPDDYVAAMVQVFREVWRVLRDDGTVWLNLGDSYTAGGSNRNGISSNNFHGGGDDSKRMDKHTKSVANITVDVKPKDLIGIPWRVAFALQADGWWLRQDIIWHKPNPMPESVKDRCTKAHEYIFLLTKSARYWYDNEAVKEEASDDSGWAKQRAKGENTWEYNDTESRILSTGQRIEASTFGEPGKRNKRSVWTVTTKPYPGSHYAVFPPDLIEPCILAGCPETVCAECGAPYERVVEVLEKSQRDTSNIRNNMLGEYPERETIGQMNTKDMKTLKRRDLGFQPTCICNAGTKAGVVLDPFAGSGTTLMVARKHRRNAIGLDLNFKYLTTNARERLQYGGYVPVADGVNQFTIELY